MDTFSCDMSLLKNCNQIISRLNKISKFNCNIFNLNSHRLSIANNIHYKHNLCDSSYLIQINKPYHTSYTEHIRQRHRNHEKIYKIINIDKLEQKYVDELWSKNQIKTHDFSREEFDLLINSLNKITFNWIQTFDSKLQRKIATEILFDALNKRMARKFIKNPQNWSIFFDNFDAISNSIINKYPIEMLPHKEEKKYLFDNFDLVVRDLMKQFKDALVPQLQLESMKKQDNTKIIENLKFIADLNESFVLYLTKYNSNKIEINFYIINSLVKSLASYIQYLIYSNKMIPSDLAKYNPIYESYIKKLDNYTERLMSFYNSNKSIEPNVKSDFYYYFSFNKEKWFKSAQALINSYDNVDLFSNLDFDCFSNALRGAIRFNDMDLFFKLCQEIKKNRHKYDYVFAGYFRTSFQSVFYEYILLRQNDIDFDTFLENLFESWNLIEFLPTSPLIEHLKTSISETKNTKNNWVYEQVTIDHKGKCSNGLLVPPNKYDGRSLDETAEIIKKNTINETPLTDIHIEAFKKLDKMLAKNKFNVVIDGLNLIYNISTGNNRVSFIKLSDILQQLEDINLSNILLIFRHHIFRRLSDDLEKLKKHHPNLKFFYLDDTVKDDLFMIYASLKSRSFIVTHDELTNHFNKLEFNSWMLKNWFYNKRFKLNNSKSYIIYPCLFKPVTQRVNEGKNNVKWFIPYYLNSSNDTDFFNPNRYLVVEKIKK